MNAGDVPSTREAAARASSLERRSGVGFPSYSIRKRKRSDPRSDLVRFPSCALRLMRAASLRFFPCLEQPSPPVPRATLRARDARSAMSTPDEGSGDDPLLLGAERSTAPAFAANAPTRHDALDPFDDSDDDGARVARPDGFHGVTPSWNIILNSMLYMAAPLSMPATTAAGGWFWSFVFWAYCSCATYWTGLVVGRAYNAAPRATSPPTPAWPARRSRDSPSAATPPTPSPRARGAEAASLSSSHPVRHLLPRHRHPDHIPAEYLAQDLPGVPRVSVGLAPRRLDRYRARRADTNLPRLEMDRRPSLRRPRRFRVSLLRGDFRRRALGLRPGPDVSSPDAVVSLRSLANFAYAYGVSRECSRNRCGRCDDRGLAAGHAMVRRRDGAAVPGVRRRRISRVRRLRQANVNLNFPDNRLNAASLVLQILQTYYLVFYTNVVMTIAVERHALGIEPGSEGGVDRGRRKSRRIAFRTAWLASQCLLASAFMSALGGRHRRRAGAHGSRGNDADDLLLSVRARRRSAPRAVSAREAMGRGGFRRRRRRRRRGGGRQRGRSAARPRGWVRGVCERERLTYAPHDPGDPCYVSGVGRGTGAAGSNCEESTAASVV